MIATHAPWTVDTLRGNLSLQPEISFRPTAVDELSLKLGLAEGDGLNPASPFVLAPWSADMETDVRDINGRGRDYLLTAWYRHGISFENGARLDLTAGIIDATEKLLITSGVISAKTVNMYRSPQMVWVYEAFDWMMPGQFEAFGHRKAFCEQQVRG